MRALPSRYRLTVLAIVSAALLALAPLPAWVVERYYSNGIYPVLQIGLTGISDTAPFALLDALMVGCVVWWGAFFVADLRNVSTRGVSRTAERILLRSVAVVATMYLAFLVAWGLNYRRVPLEDKIAYDESGVTAAAARELADEAVRQLNALYDPTRGSMELDDRSELAASFERVQRQLGSRRPARPARPKRSILDLYFRSAAVDGMTDPFFLETLLVSSLLSVERPFVVAHEWSHLAGFADERDANFVGWVTCMQGGQTEQYSAWLFLYREVTARLPLETRWEVADGLAPGPRADLRAIVARIQRYVRPAVSRAGWQIYDRYLKANRVEEGTQSYADVVRIILGTRFGPDWSIVSATPTG